MSGLDWVIAVIFLLSGLVGVLRGFIREALSIAAWVLAFWLANTFCSQFGDYIGGYVDIPAQWFRLSIAFTLIFVGTLFLLSIIGYIISKLMSKVPIKGTDRVLGMVFGIIRGGAIVVLVFLVLRGFGMDESDFWKNSNYIDYFESTANSTEQLLPEGLHSLPDKTAELLDEDTVDAIGTLLESLPESSSAE